MATVDDTKIIQAFKTKWLTLSPLPRTQYPNGKALAIEDGMFVNIQHLPSITDYPEIGVDAQAFISGMFVATIYVLEGTGSNTSTDLANLIKTKFSRNVILTYSGLSISVVKSYTMQSDSENGVFQLPVLIQYKGWV